MPTLFRTLEFLGLGIWLGSDIFLSFVVAPAAFSVLASRDQAGAIVGYSLTRLHILGVVCGLLILLLRMLRTRGVATLASPACTAFPSLSKAAFCWPVSPRCTCSSGRSRRSRVSPAVFGSPCVPSFSGSSWPVRALFALRPRLLDFIGCRVAGPLEGPPHVPRRYGPVGPPAFSELQQLLWPRHALPSIGYR